MLELEGYYRSTKASQRSLIVAEIRTWIHKFTNGFAQDAQGRLMDAIAEENRRNATKRGPVGKPEPPLPRRERVDLAYKLQMTDIIELLDARIPEFERTQTQLGNQVLGRRLAKPAAPGKDVAGGRARAERRKQIAHRVEVGGRSHLVTADFGPRFRLRMASEPGLIRAKVALAMSILEKRTPVPQGQLRDLGLIDAAALEAEVAGTKISALVSPDSSAYGDFLAKLESLELMLVAYGSSFNVQDLAGDEDPMDSVALAIKQVELTADRIRFAPADQAIITKKIERVLGRSWGRFVDSLHGRIYPYTEEAVQAVYSEDTAEDLITKKKKLRNKGGFDPARGVLFIRPGRSLAEVAATIVHEGTHFIQQEHGTAVGGFHKEFQAFAAQREFLKRLDFETQKAVPDPYRKLLKLDTDKDLEDFVKARYAKYAPVPDLEQLANVDLVFRTVVAKYPA
jgi:hypothetical protein